MPKLLFCTLTGVDASTNLDDVQELSTEFPFAEWGFLYSPKRQGAPGRYPSVEYLQNVFAKLPRYVRVALHVCGDGVPDLLREDPVITRLVEQIADRSGRVQLNFNQTKEPVDLSALAALINHRFPLLPVITQHNENNAGVWEKLKPLRNHVVLFDKSGGQGVLPGSWPTPLPEKICGYAGGLGADTLDAQFDLIAAASGGHPLWVDMEGSLRIRDRSGVDWLCTQRCRDCLHIASRRIGSLRPHY